MNKAAQIEYWYIMGFNAAILILSFTSMPVVFSNSKGWFLSMSLSPHLSLVGANIVTLAYYGSVELLISVLLPYAAEEVTSKRMKQYEKKKKRYVRAVLLVGFLLTCISMSMSFFFSQEAAEMTTEQVDITPFQEIQKTQSNDFSMVLASIESDLKEARRTERSRVHAAIAAGPEKWQKLYREKNGWFLRQKGKIGKYLASIKIEQDKAAKLEGEKQQLLMNGTSKKDEILSTVASVQAAQVQASIQSKNRKQLTFFIIACGAGVVALILAFLLGLHRDSEGRQVEDAPMSPAMIISRLSGRLWRYFSDNATQRYDLAFSGATTHATKARHKGGDKDATHKKPEPGPLSDKDSSSKVRYIDMKRDIDRIKRSLSYNCKKLQDSGDTKYKQKISDILSDDKRGVAWLESMGFECNLDKATGKLSVTEPK